MWAYHVENMTYKSRYGVNPVFGSSYWFTPGIFATLEDGGISRSDIFSALTPDVTDTEALQKELLDICPSKKSLINQAFKSKRR